MFTVTGQQLADHIPLASLPKRFGGTLEVKHHDWIAHCVKTTWIGQPNVDDAFCDASNNRIAEFLEAMNHNSSISADAVRYSVSSSMMADDESEKSDGVRECFDSAADMDLSLDGFNSPPFSPRSTSAVRKRSADASSTDSAANNLPESLGKKRLNVDGLHGVSGGVKQEESIHMSETEGMTLDELIDYCRIKGPKGLTKDYADIKYELPAGTFNTSR